MQQQACTPDPEEVVRLGEVVLTSLPSSESFVQAAEETLPQARAGQLFIEMETTVPTEVRRLAALFAARGAALVDAPCSGGPGGAGQVVKGVNQLAMGLGAAAYLEAVAFGVRCGIDPATIKAAVGGEGSWRENVAVVAEQAVAGKAREIGINFRDLPYSLREAELGGFLLPLTESLHAFCDQGERVVIDDHRQAPSFWHELLGRVRAGEE